MSERNSLPCSADTSCFLFLLLLLLLLLSSSFCFCFFGHREQSVVVQKEEAVSEVREEVNFPSKSRGADRAGVALSPLLSLPGTPQSIFVTASPVHCH